MMNSAAAEQATSFQIRIFPHNREEFPTVDSLRTWLLNGLRGRGGVYHLRSEDAVAELPVGSIVLFRYDDKIIGEAVVSKGKEDDDVVETTESGTTQRYNARITVAPSSIRLYAPPLLVKAVGGLAERNVTVAQPYYKLDFGVYPSILREVVKGGTFIS